ncbi:putative iron-only hydrogenase system regulator [Natronincola peptidivorans]|uniref:Putative iron-only hydrogenase system regulator n=1 Tax=Natronincola peptidivorans TaxID=426128 RepID=A0A1I0BJ47_9FIRM|nr:TM1266 family iron-only hydrogenase system putative regulator [Natronincola peptidivorans]SET06925.1 putative iron-only hydrogenase system regulator [Natronincola peptidivorans]
MKHKRIGVIGIVIDSLDASADKVNYFLGQYASIIVGRMGIPYKKRKISVISIIVEGTTDEIGALTGKLGRLEGVTVKSALTTKEYQEYTDEN